MVAKQDAAQLGQPVGRILERSKDRVAVLRIERDEAVTACIEPAAEPPRRSKGVRAAIGDEGRDERPRVVTADGHTAEPHSRDDTWPDNREPGA